MNEELGTAPVEPVNEIEPIDIDSSITRYSKLKRLQIRIGVWICRRFGILDAIDLRAEAAVEQSREDLEERVFEHLEASAISNRVYDLQMRCDALDKEFSSVSPLMLEFTTVVKAEQETFRVLFSNARKEHAKIDGRLSLRLSALEKAMSQQLEIVSLQSARLDALEAKERG